jgi:nucleotide-binding universal stress UspA family protein
MTERPRTILVPVDFGEASARAVEVAGALAARCDCALRLLHAETFEAPAYFNLEQIDALKAEEHRNRDQAERGVTEFGQQHTTHPFTVIIDDRPAADAILTHGATADLVVMGTHGRRGPSRWWLGSVAERVVRHLQRPLLVTRQALQSALPQDVFQRTLVHASSTLVGDHAVHYAAMLAGCLGGSVVDGRGQPIKAANAVATLLVVPTPHPPSGAWLSNVGEPLVQSCELPILFVPEPNRGSSS